MLLVIFSAPACLLSIYLAFLCYKKARYQHTMVLTLIALFMLLLTLGLLSAGFLAGLVIKVETASIAPSILSAICF